MEQSVIKLKYLLTTLVCVPFTYVLKLIIVLFEFAEHIVVEGVAYVLGEPRPRVYFYRCYLYKCKEED